MAIVNLKNHKLCNACDSAYYMPNFLTEEQESYIVEKVNSAPKPKWIQLKNRRLQNWGGIPHAKGLIPEKIPDWLNGFVKQIDRLGVFPSTNQPNHVLVNEYLPGQGIMPHLDGSLFYPTVTTISCGSHTILNFYAAPKQDGGNGTLLNKKVYSIYLERRSLLILRESMYNDYLHGIEEIKEDIVDETLLNIKSCGLDTKKGKIILPRDTRISLTVRNVPKVAKLNLNNLLKNNSNTEKH
ncbi:alpha-ketoglutarate-dependent dioxygenase alkB homolog 6 [Adelges cooleyi]|uniref:alpha-ketoglutarate-dependent dioxygenase alkB homolog 6 n=1 Tax=Adelges cooleyi TaxID=133065 RepID=UPI00218076A5|nr:alpha-ketoglutarate-dependent dioxygenase alkB homolog 6 [Adelges cooleyi]XP_050421536.1 alpha-ketoglutarate-dependent dioxygenase alkB homolog 6 [Adelges cooleyi]